MRIMNSKQIVLFIVTLMMLSLLGCKDDASLESRPATTAQIIGRVADSKTETSLSGANVLLTSIVTVDSVVTSPDGSFSLSVDLNTTGLTVFTGTLTIRKSGYKTNSFAVNVAAGSILQRDFLLERDTTTIIGGGGGTVGGTAHTFAFIGASNSEISVNGVGGTESSIITFEVRDSLGFPINIDHQDTVNFALTGTPVLGGAYVSPAAALTNASGRVATTINSGTVAGVLQFTASLRRNIDGVVIQSTPVVLTVNAGLPDQTHFSVAPHQHNFAAYNWLAVPNEITVQVGDKYSNPVKTGTAVYFNTTGGVIEASGFTSPTSHASVILYSGNPLPFDARANYGTGYARVRAFTQGENNSYVYDSVSVLFSAIVGQIDITNQFSVPGVQDTFSIPSGQCDRLFITIKDINNNPLAPGTTVRSELEFARSDTALQFNVTGLPDDAFDDYLFRGPGRTEFDMTICDLTPPASRPSTPQLVTLTIRVTSPNGNASKSIRGYWRP